MKWKSTGVLLLMLLIQLSVGTSPAQATSYYDDKVTVINKLEVVSAEGVTDLTLDWERVFLGVLERINNAESTEMLAQYNANIATGSGWLVQSYVDGMRVMTFDPTATVDIETSTGGYDFLGFDSGRVCVWETGGHNFKDWHNLDANPLHHYVSVICKPHDELSAAYRQYYDWGWKKWPFLFIASDNIHYPSGYTGTLVPTKQPEAKYVALGDSFSGGEGNPPFEYGTDRPGVNECHRSPQAYPRLLQKNASLELGPTAFVACTGAITSDVTAGDTDDSTDNWGEGPQVDVLTSDTDVVTITIGGNDVGFADYVKACYFTVCGYGTPAYTTITNKIASSAFHEDLVATYLEILQKASSAQLYVINYPYIVKDKSAEGCTAFSGGLTSNDAAAEEVARRLNTAILNAYLDIKQDIQWSSYATRLNLVEVNYSDSPFDGHDLCAEDINDVYFYPLDLQDPGNPKTLHPTPEGQMAYRDTIKDVID